MRRIKAIIQQFHLLNIILMVLLILLVTRVAHLAFFSRPDYAEPREKVRISKSLEDARKHDADRPVSLITDYSMVTENNLFHPSRSVLETNAQPIEADSKAAPEFVLYGTLITPEFSLAYLEDLKAPVVSSRGRKKQVTLRKGETLSGYTLKDIAEDQVIMSDDDVEITIYLTAEKSRQPVSAPTQEAKAKTPSTPIARQQVPVTKTKKPLSDDAQSKKAGEEQTKEIKKESSDAGQKFLDFFRRAR